MVRLGLRGWVARRRRPGRASAEPANAAYRGDYEGRATIEYAPRADGDADPGEVVWAWVPFEEDPTQGKDRPVLVLARSGGDLLGLMLTSKDHDRDPRRPDGPVWFDIGTGAWDRQGRPSEVRLDRVLRLAPGDVRREGAALDRTRFEQVAAAARDTLGW
ncbi:type II toxin-antitoxin system PemK/MazF family toxin [Nocardioides rubriscoriae]|uniref:type II toxin-antitoxin system PemK/MazF family toxin n=1 Tax=Nocardioides rubriscoriae TaxID=642762 RepID=UPI0011DF3320|nr:type II toxin-antitoxin system PemK/MazF family toxin [Nocardioides rubriscoriae]